MSQPIPVVAEQKPLTPAMLSIHIMQHFDRMAQVLMNQHTEVVAQLSDNRRELEKLAERVAELQQSIETVVQQQGPLPPPMLFSPVNNSYVLPSDPYQHSFMYPPTHNST